VISPRNFRKNFPATAELFDQMADEESGHRGRLIELYQKKFGEHIPLIRRQDVKGFMAPRSSVLLQSCALKSPGTGCFDGIGRQAFL